MSMHKYYKIDTDGKLIRLNPFCPRCGPGFFMAQNYDRLTCGRCSFTEFKKRVPKKVKTDDEGTPGKVSAETKKGKEPIKGKKKGKKK